MRDLRMKLFIDPDSMKAKYATSPAWLKSLMDRVGRRAELLPLQAPERQAEGHHALRAVDGAHVQRRQHRRRHRAREPARPRGVLRRQAREAKAITELETSSIPPEPTGSNGVAIAPSNTTNKHALLLINPHTSFFFRSEVQVSSDEGLNAYGAVTWGQFFVYQGFNERVGWMHTSSGVDNIDEYAESIVKKGDSVFYQYGKDLRPLVVAEDHGAVQVRHARWRTKEFTVYRTQHGPIVRERRRQVDQR